MASETVNREGTQLDEDSVWTTTEDGERVPNYDATFPTINEGEVVHGTVVRVDKDEVLVDIGYKSEGVIPVIELSIRRSVNPADEVTVGDEIDALVLTKEDAEGRLILSKKRARFELAWKAIEQAAESGEPVLGKVIEVVKGGLILDLGVRGFLPASLVDIRRVQDLDEFLGQELRAKVIELNRSRNNVVLSRRAVLEDERKEMRQAILDRLNPGDVVDGQISNIVDFGAFVDLDGMDGLIHISELSWSHVNHPSEVLEIGQDVKVKVLDIDRERQRISLGLKQTQSDPWQQVLETYNEGDEVEGRVTKVVTFGAFVEIMPGVEGLVHISELAQHHVENPREVVSQGDLVKARIIEVDAERRRLSLSLKRVEGGGVQERVGDSEAVEGTPNLDLSEEVFPEGAMPPAETAEAADGTEEAAPAEQVAEVAEEDTPAEEQRRRGASSRGAARRGAGRRAGARAERRGRGSRAERRSRASSRARVALARPIAVAITGGIGAGKSEALAAFARHGAATVSSDAIVHHLLREDEEVQRALVDRLGDRVLDDTGQVDRGAIAEIVFADEEALQWLEGLLHPLVVREYLDWREQLGELDNPPAVCVTEVPLLYEVGGQDRFDSVVVVTAPPEVRASRTEVAVAEREPRLLPDTVKVAQADFAYVNDGSLEELDAFVAAVLEELTR